MGLDEIPVCEWGHGGVIQLPGDGGWRMGSDLTAEPGHRALYEHDR